MTDYFIFGVAYPAGLQADVQTGADGFTDVFENSELEQACWYFGKNHPQINLNHNDEVVGIADVVENCIWRGEPKEFENKNGLVSKINTGDWCVGAQIKDLAIWEMIQNGEINGWSIQGSAKRVEI